MLYHKLRFILVDMEGIKSNVSELLCFSVGGEVADLFKGKCI